MSRATCPKCGCTDVSWIRDDADCAQYICLECKQCFSYPPKTLFNHITASPEVLAERSVYAHECCRIPDGATSPFIDDIFWFDDEKGDTWDERFDSAWEKAISATLAKLKEVLE